MVNDLSGLNVHHDSVKSGNLIATEIVIAAYKISIFIGIPVAAFNQMHILKIKQIFRCTQMKNAMR